MISIFVGHGSPMNAIDENAYTEQWALLGKKYKPKGILAISGHWVTNGTKIQTAKAPKKINDMYGFPKALYDLEYPVSGDEELSNKVIELTNAEVDNTWGIDHGIWSILVHMYPKADIPVVQMSLDRNLSPKEHFELGKKISVLRKEGYMILGSGNVVHSFKNSDMSLSDGLPFAKTFDNMIEEIIISEEHEKLLDYQKLEGADKSFETTEHFDPLLYIVATSESDSITVFNKDYDYGAFSMTSYIFEKHA